MGIEAFLKHLFVVYFFFSEHGQEIVCSILSGHLTSIMHNARDTHPEGLPALLNIFKEKQLLLKSEMLFSKSLSPMFCLTKKKYKRMDCIFNATFFPTSFFVRKLKRPKKKKKKAREALWMWMLSPVCGVWWRGASCHLQSLGSPTSTLQTSKLNVPLYEKKQYIQKPEDFL